MLSCNRADERLYAVYQKRFAELIKSEAASAAFAAARSAVVAAPAKAAPPFSSKYPINCQQPNTGPPERRRWKLLNSCAGRVAPR